MLATGRAQEAVRVSLAGAAAAEARNQAATSPGYYNLKLGMTSWRFGTGLGMQYNDNVTYTDTSSEGDFILQPSISAQMLWPVTEQNSLNLNLGGGYSFYTVHTELSQFFVTPGSELSFDLYVGDFWINLHDRLSVSQSSYQDPTMANTGGDATLENTVGISGVWDLNKINARLSYDHGSYITLGGNDSSQPNREAEIVSGSVGYAAKQEMLFGVESGASWVNYDSSSGPYLPYTSAVQVNLGAFTDSRISEHITVRAGAGYTVFTAEGSSTNAFGNDNTLSGVYGYLLLHHSVNQFLDYSLSGGRNISYSFYGGTADNYFGRLQANWKIFLNMTLSTFVDYNTGTQYYQFSDEDYSQFGTGIGLSRPITRKLGAALNYSYYNRDSDQPGRSYDANIVILSLSYRF